MFSRALFKQSAKANWIKWLTVTIATAVMLAIVIIVLGNLGINNIRDSLKNVFLQADQDSQLKEDSIDSYKLYLESMDNFNNIEKLSEINNNLIVRYNVKFNEGYVTQEQKNELAISTYNEYQGEMEANCSSLKNVVSSKEMIKTILVDETKYNDIKLMIQKFNESTEQNKLNLAQQIVTEYVMLGRVEQKNVPLYVYLLVSKIGEQLVANYDFVLNKTENNSLEVVKQRVANNVVEATVATLQEQISQLTILITTLKSESIKSILLATLLEHTKMPQSFYAVQQQYNLALSQPENKNANKFELANKILSENVEFSELSKNALEIYINILVYGESSYIAKEYLNAQVFEGAYNKEKEELTLKAKLENSEIEKQAMEKAEDAKLICNDAIMVYLNEKLLNENIIETFNIVNYVDMSTDYVNKMIYKQVYDMRISEGATENDAKQFAVTIKVLSNSAINTYQLLQKEGKTEEEARKEATYNITDQIPEKVNEAMAELGNMDMYGLIIGSIFYRIAGLLLPMVFVIMTANGLLAGQVDSGSMAYVLSTPTKRKTVTFTQMIYLITSLFVMYGVLTTVSTISVCIAGGNSFAINYAEIILFNLGAFLTMFAFAGFCFMCSAIFNTSKHSLSIGGGLTIFSLVCTILGLFGSDVVPSAMRISAMNYFNYLSIITLFDTVSILGGGLDYLWKFGILFAIGIVTFIIGIFRFDKKDLPL